MLELAEVRMQEGRRIGEGCSDSVIACELWLWKPVEKSHRLSRKKPQDMIVGRTP
jgi:hypothetical protein